MLDIYTKIILPQILLEEFIYQKPAKQIFRCKMSGTQIKYPR